jgi:hypothetical protein
MDLVRETMNIGNVCKGLDGRHTAKKLRSRDICRAEK